MCIRDSPEAVEEPAAIVGATAAGAAQEKLVPLQFGVTPVTADLVFWGS